MNDLPPRQKSQRLINKVRPSTPNSFSGKPALRKVVTDNNLYPGLNDISDALEALPLDLVKFFTLLKEIDAKCVNLVPRLNNSIKNFIENNDEKKEVKERNLYHIKQMIKELMPCIEEKMNVATIATDLVAKHLLRVDDDYKIIMNDEIPESIRIGPLNHPAMIMDSKGTEGAKSSQSQRSESRREALAAKKSANNNDDEVSDKKNRNRNQNQMQNVSGSKESTPNVSNGHNNTYNNLNNGNNNTVGNTQNNNLSTTNNNHSNGNSNGSTNTKKRNRNGVTATSSNLKDLENDDISRPGTPSGKKRQPAKVKKPKDESVTNSPSNHSHHLSREESPMDQDEPLSPPSNEPLYCYCNQVSFGEMVGCDGNDCKREWFHLPCIGLKQPPKGKWYCEDCSIKLRKKK